MLTKWLLPADPNTPPSFSDYEGIINGGDGRFFGASGRVFVTDVVIVNGLLTEATFNLRVIVPKSKMF